MWSFNSFKSVTDAKFEPSNVAFLRLMPSTGCGPVATAVLPLLSLVDASAAAASSVLFVGCCVEPVHGVAAVCVSFKSVAFVSACAIFPKGDHIITRVTKSEYPYEQ